jgi:hypothetical protein
VMVDDFLSWSDFCCCCCCCCICREYCSLIDLISLLSSL